MKCIFLDCGGKCCFDCEELMKDCSGCTEMDKHKCAEDCPNSAKEEKDGKEHPSD